MKTYQQYYDLVVKKHEAPICEKCGRRTDEPPEAKPDNNNGFCFSVCHVQISTNQNWFDLTHEATINMLNDIANVINNKNQSSIG